MNLNYNICKDMTTDNLTKKFSHIFKNIGDNRFEFNIKNVRIVFRLNRCFIDIFYDNNERLSHHFQVIYDYKKNYLILTFFRLKNKNITKTINSKDHYNFDKIINLLLEKYLNIKDFKEILVDVLLKYI